MQRDVLAYLETRDKQTLLRSTVAPQPQVGTVSVAPPVSATSEAEATQDIATSNMRKAIAKRTVQSKQNTPHFYVTMLIEMDRALALLKELNVDATKDEKVTVNDIIVKACARSLAKVPEVETRHGRPKTPFGATLTPISASRSALTTAWIIPVVRDCHKKTLREISLEAKQLITRARNNQLKPEEYQGSTFSVSNLGMMGVDEFIAIINPPEAAILAIGGIAREPVVVGDTDEIVIRSRMESDHQRGSPPARRRSRRPLPTGSEKKRWKPPSRSSRKICKLCVYANARSD